MHASPLITLSPSSPSFNSYSSRNLVDIATRVVQEFTKESSESESETDHTTNIFSWLEDNNVVTEKNFQQENNHINTTNQNTPNNNNDGCNDDGNDDNDDDDFEFAVVYREQDTSPITADEIFYNGQIRPIYPLFNTDLLLNLKLNEEESSYSLHSSTTPKPAVRSPLRKLFDEDREKLMTMSSSSCSSSEADELGGVPAGTYCVWTPKEAEKSPGRCKKSNSTGNNSKRWKFRDLVFRSNSDGKDSFVFLTHKKSVSSTDERLSGNHHQGKENYDNIDDDKEKGAKEMKGSVVDYMSNNNREHGVIKDGDHKRRSFLPYKQELMGLFSNVNGLSRNLHPF